MGELFEKGTYTAQYGETGALIAMDEYIIGRTSDGFKIQSNNNIFGQNGFRQLAEIEVDDQWMMQRLHIAVVDKNIELNANFDNGSVRIIQSHEQKEVSKLIPLQFSQYIFIYNGALVIPTVWLRGFDFNSFEKTQYQLLPAGMAEVKQIKQTNESDRLHFSLNLQVNGITDIVNITTDYAGKVILYESALSKLRIKPQL